MKYIKIVYPKFRKNILAYSSACMEKTPFSFCCYLSFKFFLVFLFFFLGYVKVYGFYNGSTEKDNYKYKQESNLGNKHVLIYEKFAKMPLQLLLDKGLAYFSAEQSDSAFICFNLINGCYRPDMLEEDQLLCATASNRLGVIYCVHKDYVQALKSFLWAIDIYSKYGKEDKKMSVYNNMAILYGKFGDNTRAYSLLQKVFAYFYAQKQYKKAGIVLNNLAFCVIELGNLENVKKCIYFTSLPNLYCYPSVAYSYNLAKSFYCRKMGIYDSSIYFAKKTLWYIESSITKNEILADSYFYIAQAYKDANRYDSAIVNLEKSNYYAVKSDHLTLLTVNYKQLSEIYSILNKKEAYLKAIGEYLRLNDSLQKTQQYATIRDMEYNLILHKNKTEIEKLQEKQQKEHRLVVAQRRVIVVISTMFLFFSLLFIVWSQRKKLAQNNRKFYIKNKELMAQEQSNRILRKIMQESEDKTLKTSISWMKSVQPELASRYANSPLQNEQKANLTKRIYEIMEHDPQIYNSDFNMEKLVKELKSNITYVSQIINENFSMSFTSLLNEYRVKQACKYLDDQRYWNYTIEYIAQEVGFKNRTSFNPVFKKQVGITPSQYRKISKDNALKSL
ncbi:MAG: helix-turn-helix domain-containing protein [Bacteroidales bacterium]